MYLKCWGGGSVEIIDMDWGTEAAESMLNHLEQ